MNQLDIFGGEKAHAEVAKERAEQEWRDKVRADPEFARRNLILGALNRRGALTDKQLGQYLGYAPIDVSSLLAQLRKKNLVIALGEGHDGGWLHQAVVKREE